MPTYTFRDGDGNRVEVFMPVSEYERCVVDGVLVRDGKRLERDMVADVPGGTPSGGWPMMSDAMGVHPSQIREAQEHAAARGVHTEYAPDGRAILRDRNHRKAHMRAMGFRDNDGGYGD